MPFQQGTDRLCSYYHQQPTQDPRVSTVNTVGTGVRAAVGRTRDISTGDERKSGGELRGGELRFEKQHRLTELLRGVDLVVPPVRAGRLARDPGVVGFQRVAEKGRISLVSAAGFRPGSGEVAQAKEMGGGRPPRNRPVG